MAKRNARAAKGNKNKLGGKYVARRAFLIFLLIALIGAGCVYAGYSIAMKKPEEAPAQPSRSEPSALESSAPAPAAEETSGISVPEPEPPASSNVPAAEIDEWNLLLVNKENPLPEDFEVELEKVVDDYKVDKRVMEPLLRMIASAREDGITLMICSAYRDVAYQEKLFANKVAELLGTGLDEEEAIATTATIITNPGTSEHHTGLAVDIVTPERQSLDDGFETTPAFAWLNENAAGYGFILRYPRDKEAITTIIYEPWHYRYVGVETAKEIKASGVCLEEYIYNLKNPVRPADDDIEEPTDGEDQAEEPPEGTKEPEKSGG